ncbi:43938_t:CDS:1, partial [Gigaspora margarita]
IKGDNQIKEIIAGGNELSSLDLANCANLTKLMVADNVYLNKFINLNLAKITNINTTNTLVNLAADLETLQQENKELCKIVRKTDDVLYEKELVLPEPIQTLKQAEEAIQRRLAKTATE